MCDCETREVYTIKVDSTNINITNSNAASFVAYLPVTLTNVVKAELLSACVTISANTHPVVYVHVEELISKFHDRASVTYTVSSAGASSTVGTLSAAIPNTNKLAESLVAIPVDTTRIASFPVIFTSAGFFPVTVDYINPIRKLDRLTINLFTSQGTSIGTAAPTFLTFRFECAKGNKCLY